MEDELLQRARRLCLAARELQLPVLVAARAVDPGEQGEHEETALNDPAVVENEAEGAGDLETDDKLPLIAVPGALKPKKEVKRGGEKKRRLTQQARRLEEEKKRQEKRLEQVKQAQERARARVARTNQLEQQQTLRAEEQQQSEVVNAAEQCAEKIRRAQESRRRAKERVRLKREEKNTETPPSFAVPGLRTAPPKVKSFRRKPKALLQGSTQQTVMNSKLKRESTPEREENIDPDQKLLERQLRQETTARLQRMKQLAENQKRQEQEEFEQGLQKFKSKARGMHRAAKGLSKQPSLPSLPQLNNPSFETEEPREEFLITPSVSDAPCSRPASKQVEWRPTQEFDSSSDSDDEFNHSSSRSNQTDLPALQLEGTSTRGGRSRIKILAWKQPPVPMQPVQCYSYKAIPQVYSRASVTAPVCTSAALLGPSTRLRAPK